MGAPDVVVVGAGHNGLIAAAYLAKAGLCVHVLERRALPGGCTATEELAPGVRVNRCHCDHTLLYTTPIPDELDLAGHGLENILLDPPHVAPRLNDEGLVFWQDLDRTVDGIGARSAKDARAYRRFVRQWTDLFRWLQPILLGDPTPRRAAARMARTPGRTLAGLRHLPLLQRAQRASVRDLLDATFDDMHLKGVLAFASAGIAGQHPAAPGTALTAVAAVLLHAAGVRHPRGGSGALARALVAVIEAHGGTVRTGAPVERIRVEHGTVRGVRLADTEEIDARTVVAACDPQTTFLRLLDHQVVPVDLRAAIERLQIANGYTLKVDYVLDRLPEWRPHPAITAEEQARATKYVCPSIEYLEAAFDDFQQGRNPRWPALMVSTPTAADPSLVPDGRQLLTLETRYTPYELAGGVSWEAIREREAERLFEFFLQYTPNLAGVEHAAIMQSPADLARDLALPRGHQLHLDAGASQNLHKRPIPQLANYRTPIGGLYLTGAGTHPGGGVWGAPGRNTAHEILADLG